MKASASNLKPASLRRHGKPFEVQGKLKSRPKKQERESTPVMEIRERS